MQVMHFSPCYHIVIFMSSHVFPKKERKPSQKNTILNFRASVPNYLPVAT